MKEFEDKLSLPIPIRYQSRHPANARELVILLHGYQEHADRMAKLILPFVPSDAAVLIPNGPFPVPRIKDGHIKEGYSWYFFNTQTQTMVVPPDAAVSMIVQVLVSQNATHLPIRIVGFSQGGYFALILAQRIPNVRQVIAIAAGFPERYIKSKPAFRIDAVHGERDKVCDFKNAQEEHKTLKSKHWAGEFIALPNSEHRIDDDVQANVAQLLTLPLPSRASN
jgi:predicted esterase